MTRSVPRRSDRGSGVVEFVLLTVLLVTLLFAVLQLAVWFYARNVVASATADAARYAATVGGSPGPGERRARALIGQGLSASTAGRIRCVAGSSVDPDSRLPTTTVHCRGRMPMALLPFELPLTIDARSAALTEATP